MRSDEDSRSVRVPAEVFEALIPEIRDLGELKVLLHVVHLGALSGSPAVPFTQLLDSNVSRSIVGSGSPVPAVERLRRAVDRAVANNVLLRLSMDGPDGPEMYLLPATQPNRDAVDRMSESDKTAEALGLPINGEVTLYRPNVFAFYERHIGPLSPLVAEQLRDAERSYPRSWIEAAIGEAVNYNRRNWRYIQSILVRWEAEGAPNGVANRSS